MAIFEKPLSEYLAFSKLFLVLVPIVGIARLALSLSGSPDSTAKWISMTAVMWIAVIYYSIRVPTSGFGTSRHLLVLLALINLAAQAVAIVGIVTGIVSGSANIFTRPEYAFGGDGSTWTHVAAHLFIGTIVGSLVYWLLGSLFMLGAKKLAGDRNSSVAARA